MEITCVIPAFENLDLAARCLTSVAVQRDVDFEVIVTDDSASSAVADFFAAFSGASSRLRYVKGPRSGNPVANWNHGLDQAKGEFCVLVHHDEFLVDPLYFRRAIEAMKTSGGPAAVARTTVIGVGRRSRFELVRGLARGMGGPAWLLPIANWVGPTAAFVFRRGPKFDESLMAMVDVDFYRRVMRAGRLAFLDQVCVGSLGHHRAQISDGLDFPTTVARELRALSLRTPAGVGRFEYDVQRTWLKLARRAA